MLNFLSAGNQRQVLGIALTPGVGLEAAVLDRTKQTILNYGTRKVEYNFSSREIQDYVEFKTAIAELVEEMKIPPKTMVYLVLPNVYFGFTNYPPMITPDEIKTVILSEAESFYLFKRNEPVSGWAEIYNPEGGSQKKAAFASFQKSVVDEIKEIISDLDLQLVGVESSFSATLRGLFVSNNIDDVILEEATWTAMLIGTNSYTLFQLEGKHLIDCTEIPLAIKSFSMEEAYQAIISSSSQFLVNHPTTKIYIISQTDDICADVLKRQMQFDKDIIAIDSNKYSKKPLMEVLGALDFNQANSLTLAAIGAASVTSDFGLSLNVLADDPNASMGVYFTKFGIEVTKDFVTRLSGLIAVIFLILSGAVFGISSFINQQIQTKISNFQDEIKSIEKQIQAETKTETGESIDIINVIDEIAANNVMANSFYDSISNDIPKNVWLTKYYNKEGAKIAIRGIAESIVDIYEYYKNLRVVSPQSNIKLTELKVVTEDVSSEDNKYLTDLAIDRDTDRLYSFEIANTPIRVERKANSGDSQQNEFDIILQPLNGDIEKTSTQMRPTR